MTVLSTLKTTVPSASPSVTTTSTSTASATVTTTTSTSTSWCSARFEGSVFVVCYFHWLIVVLVFIGGLNFRFFQRWFVIFTTTAVIIIVISSCRLCFGWFCRFFLF